MSEGTAGGPELESVTEQRARCLSRAVDGKVAWEELVERIEADTSRPRTMILRAFIAGDEGFPGRFAAVLVGVAAVLVTIWAVSGSSGTTFIGLVLMLILWALALRLWKHAPRDESIMLSVLWLDQELRLVRVRAVPDGDALDGGMSFGFDEVAEVLFARRLLRSRGSRVALEGAGVFLRLVDGSVWPVVSGARDVEAAFRAASACALRIGVGVKQVGAGWGS